MSGWSGEEEEEEEDDDDDTKATVDLETIDK
jgi:hypothetical protein